ADIVVGAFEHCQEELVLDTEIVIDQALVGARAARDLVDARAVEPLFRKLADRGLQDALTRTRRIAPDRRVFLLRRSGRARAWAFEDAHRRSSVRAGHPRPADWR